MKTYPPSNPDHKSYSVEIAQHTEDEKESLESLRVSTKALVDHDKGAADKTAREQSARITPATTLSVAQQAAKDEIARQVGVQALADKVAAENAAAGEQARVARMAAAK